MKKRCLAATLPRPSPGLDFVRYLGLICADGQASPGAAAEGLSAVAEQGRSNPEVAHSSKTRLHGARVEWLFAVGIMVLIAVAGERFAVDGFLPQPFYFLVDQTLMDLYSTAYWDVHGGAYLTWHSLYPPLSFVFVDLFSIHKCYARGAAAGRLCDWRSATSLLLFFILNVWLVFRSYRWMRIEAPAPRTIAVCLGLPMLYALERGNLLIPCFTAFVLAFGDLLRWKPARWLAMAVAVNFKPYLIFSLLPFVGRRAVGGLILCGLLFLAVYGLTFLAEGAGSPLEVIANESRYAGAKTSTLFSDIYFATSYWPLIRLLRAAPPGLTLATPEVARAIALSLEILIRLSQVAFFACCALALLRPRPIDVRRFGAMVACISLTAFTTGSAGYVQIFLFFLLLYEPWRGPIRMTMLIGAYLLCLPVDYVILPVVHDHAVSFLSGRAVVTRFGLSVGQLVRPGILLVIQWGLIVINFGDLMALGAGSRGRPANLAWFSDARPAPAE